jgi:hypothetical protein
MGIGQINDLSVKKSLVQVNVYTIIDNTHVFLLNISVRLKFVQSI